EAPAGPPEHGRIQLFERLHHVLADAPDVGDVRILSHPKSFVNAAAQVLGEVPVDVFLNRDAPEVGTDDDSIHTPPPFLTVLAAGRPYGAVFARGSLAGRIRCLDCLPSAGPVGPRIMNILCTVLIEKGRCKERSNSLSEDA